MRLTSQKRRPSALPAALIVSGLLPVATAALHADPAGTTTAQQPTASADTTTTPQPATTPEIVIDVKVKKASKEIPQANASQTVVAAPIIQHSDPDETLPEIIGRFVPGASANPDNGLRIRGADDQFETYLDGIPVPQSVSGSITDVLDPKDIQSLRIYTGGFPAEFGNQLSGVFDITTQSGSDHPSGSISQSVASESSYVTSARYGGSDGRLRYFISGSSRETNFYLNPPTEDPINDAGHEDHGFFKVNYDDGSNDSLILQLGANGSSFQNPDTPDTQQESGTLANLGWSHVEGLANTRVSLYTHTSSLRYNGSPADLVAEDEFETNEDQRANTIGVRVDQTFPAGRQHLLKAGFDVSKSTVDQDFSIVLPAPGGILSDESSPHAWNTGLSTRALSGVT